MGIAAAAYGNLRVIEERTRVGPPSDSPLMNIADLAITSGAYFLAAWAAVRIVAWVVSGFVSDRTKLPK